MPKYILICIQTTGKSYAYRNQVNVARRSKLIGFVCFLSIDGWQTPETETDSKNWIEKFYLPQSDWMNARVRVCVLAVAYIRAILQKKSNLFGIEEKFEIEIYRHLKEFMAWNAWRWLDTDKFLEWTLTTNTHKTRTK